MTKFAALIFAFSMLLSLHGKSIEQSVNWKNLKWHTNFKVLNKNVQSNPQTRFKVTSDSNFIYFMVEALEPAMNKLVTKKQAYPDDFSIWSNDGIEIGISNDRNYQKDYKIAIDHAGQYADCFAQDDNTRLCLSQRYDMGIVPYTIYLYISRRGGRPRPPVLYLIFILCPYHIP